ncbi:MAG: sulfotransferase family 2 domain-containing protein [Flavobacteriaceae bacterium]|nr:sulfotransferase family 2 domain-containing protein [Flavobacteriaceae bacterium]
MIINHTYKFIFVKTQKTAGTSLEIALSEFCGDQDVITPISKEDEAYRMELGFPGPRNYTVTRKKESGSIFGKKTEEIEFYNHISCKEIKNMIHDEMYDSYYKFCFERNPYDKLISLYFHQGGDEVYDSIEDFILKGGLKIIKGFDQYTIDKVIAVDDIFRFEELGEALKKLTEKLGLPKPLQMPPKKTKSRFRKDKRHYSEVLTDKEKSLVDTIWAREKALLGYEY